MAAAATILYVGDDFCHRIPVMEMRGIHVVRSECSVGEVRRSLAAGDGFSAVTFHNDLFAPAESVISAAREICSAPLVLFRNPSIDCNERVFDFVIPVPTPPEIWSNDLTEAIQESRRLQEYTQQLHKDCADAREWSEKLREMTAQNRARTFDYNAFFWAEGDETGNDNK